MSFNTIRSEVDTSPLVGGHERDTAIGSKADIRNEPLALLSRPFLPVAGSVRIIACIKHREAFEKLSATWICERFSPELTSLRQKAFFESLLWMDHAPTH